MLGYTPTRSFIQSVFSFRKTDNVFRSFKIHVFLQFSRNTMMLKRTFPVSLYKKGNAPRIRRCNRFLEYVENTDVRPQQKTDVVLTSHVTGIGNKGDIVSLKRSFAYYKLILPGLADYPTIENLEYANNLKKDVTLQANAISPSVEFCMKFLEKTCVLVFMNKEIEWTIEPWHIRASFRRAGVHILSNSSIIMPSQQIKGPDMNIQGKDFYVTVKINKEHEQKVRCRIHHWSTSPSDRLALDENYWNTPVDNIFSSHNMKSLEN